MQKPPAKESEKASKVSFKSKFGVLLEFNETLI